MSKKVKALELDALRKAVGGVKDYVVIEPLGPDSATEFDFRKKLRAKKIKTQMVKNTYAKKVFGEMGITLDVWGGPTVLCWGGANIKELSNTVDTAVKESKKDPKAPEKYKVKTAVADGEAIGIEDAKKRPTREEAIGEIVAALAGAGSSLAACLTGPAAQLASILTAIEEKKPEGEAATSEPAAPAAAG